MGKQSNGCWVIQPSWVWSNHCGANLFYILRNIPFKSWKNKNRSKLINSLLFTFLLLRGIFHKMRNKKCPRNYWINPTMIGLDHPIPTDPFPTVQWSAVTLSSFTNWTSQVLLQRFLPMLAWSRSDCAQLFGEWVV